MKLRLHLALLTAPTFVACVEPDPAPSSAVDTPAACTSAYYGDGVCHPKLACAEPDIDCFAVFDSYASAEAAAVGFDAGQAQADARTPYQILPPTDPRYIKMRALLSRGWEVYREEFALGLLKRQTPELVMFDTPNVNAYAFGHQAKSAFAVVVYAGLLSAGLSDDELLHIMLHELTHAVRLHAVGQQSERFYHVTDGQEPLGFNQVHVPADEALIWRWIERAKFAGHLTDPLLSGIAAQGSTA